MRKQGYGRTKEMIMFMASKAIKKNGNVTADQLPDAKWWQSFCTRNNQPVSSGIDEHRTASKSQVNEILLNNCAQQLFDALTNNKFGINFLEHPELIFSSNENFFDLEETSKQILNFKEGADKDKQVAEESLSPHVTDQTSNTVDGKISVSLIDDEKLKNLFDLHGKGKAQKSSVITCVNALGHLLPPFFVHSPQTTDFPFGNCERYTQERLDEDFFLLWFHEVFLRNLARRGPCLLIYDGQNCLVTREMLMAASVNDVIMFCIPASCTDELQPIDMSANGIFSDVWRSVVLNKEFDHELTHHSFTRIFQDVWLSAATESVIAERFKLTGIFPFSRQITAPKSLGADFEGDDFGQERFSAFLGPDSDVNLQARKKDSPMNLPIRNQRSNTDQQTDGNQNFMRPGGRLTRPTMSILNQPLNDVPMINQMIGDEDEFREDFPEISNSADEFSSCSDDGGTSMVALSSGITSVPSLVTYKNATDSVSYSPTDHVTSPKMAPQKRHHSSKVTDVVMHERQMLSTSGPARTMVPQYQRVIHSVPGSLSRKRPSSFADMRPNTAKNHLPSIRHPPPDARSEVFTRATSELSELRALEEVLDKGRKAKFFKAFDGGLVYTEDNDPLYQLWRSLKLKSLNTPTYRNDFNLVSCQVNQVSPSIIEIRPKTTCAQATESRQIPALLNHNCQCSESLRTILTPAGNISVNKNATVIVIMPEKQDCENLSASIESNGTTREQSNRSTSV